MELNTSGLNKTIREMNPGPVILAEMKARNIPVVIGADAHRPERTGDQFAAALENLRQAGYDEVSYFLDRRREHISLAAAVASLPGDQSALSRLPSGH